MREKDFIISTCVHHISTIVGLLTSICYLTRKSSMRQKESYRKKCALVLFMIIQSWAGLKILTDFYNGTSRLWESYKDIRRLSKSKRQERNILWGLTFLSSAFKMGLPHLFA